MIARALVSSQTFLAQVYFSTQQYYPVEFVFKLCDKMANKRDFS